MPGQGRHMTIENIQRVIYLLATTEMAVREVAERMGCSKSAVIAINRRFQVRRYNGLRSQWMQGSISKRASEQCPVEDVAHEDALPPASEVQ